MLKTTNEVFPGFPDTAQDFFVGLAADNSKDYWQANRQRFETEIREPMTALAAALEPHVGSLRLFRMNRDVRFSKDKSPYKTQQGALHDRANGGVFYLHLDADGLLVASGDHVMARDQLGRFRDMVADDRTGPAFLEVIDTLTADGLTVGGGIRDPLKTAPRGYAKDHPRIAWLRWKGAVAGRRIDDADRLASPDLVDEIVRFHDASAPLLKLLDRHVGPSSEPRPER